VDAAEAMADARRRSRLSRREIATRSGTSAATIIAYETGRVQPSVPVLARIVRAAGFDLVLDVVAHRPDISDEARGAELVSALRLAAQFPARHPKRWRAPIFPRR
jgi:transcriptional regulator with XRE-family HTH domain